MTRNAASVAAGLALLAATGVAEAGCEENEIELRIDRTEWVETSPTDPYPVLKGTAILANRCAEPVGVRVRLRAIDKDGNTVAVGELWPFGRKNVPTGEHSFSIDQWLGHDAAISGFQLETVAVRQWP